MEIKIPQSKLTKALGYVSKAVGIKPNIPVLANVLLEVNKTNIRLSATNLDMGINLWIPGQVQTEGAVTVSGKLLADFVAATGEGNIVLKLEKEMLTATAEKADAEFATIPAQEFPVLPKVTGEPLCSVSTTELAKTLNKVIFSCAADNVTSRMQYTGVYWEFGKPETGKLTLVGLDGYRLSRKVLTVQGLAESALPGVIVPSRSLQELARILASEPEQNCEVYLNPGNTQMVFKLEGLELSVRLIEGPYPDYEKVLPSEASLSFAVDKSELEHALKVVFTFARNIQGYRVDWDLDLETTTLTMRSTLSQVGQNQVQIKLAEVDGSTDFKAAYSLQYLLDLVNHTTGSQIQFSASGPMTAAKFADNEDPDYLHIIMPLERDV